MSNTLYETDFYGWLDQTIDMVRKGRLDEIDPDILLDELESMGKRDRRELSNRLVILIAHLLKWQLQPDAQSSRWIGSIAAQRLQIAGQLEDSPSLKNLLPVAIQTAYPKAMLLAAKETGQLLEGLPETCPYALPQLLDDDFYPASPAA